MGFGSFFKIAKNVGTFIEIVDTTADVATLGDEIAKAALGDDYDPAFRDKSQEVAEVGKQVDAKVAQVKNVQTDIDNLDNAMNTLDLSLELYDFKQVQVKELMEKVGQFNLTFGDFPTAYAWLTGPAQRTDNHLSAEEFALEIKEVQEYLAQISFSPAVVAITSAELLFTAVCHAIRKRKRFNQPSTPTVRQRRNAFSGMEMLDDAHAQAIKKIRRNRKIAIGADVVSKTASSISLGFTIYSIFSRVNGRNKAFKALEKQLQEYEDELAAYNYLIGGYSSAPDNQAIREAVEVVNSLQEQIANLEEINPEEVNLTELNQNIETAEENLSSQLNNNDDFAQAKFFFQVDDPDNPEEKIEWSTEDDLGLAFGMKSIVEQSNERGDIILTNIRNLFEDMIEALDSTLNSTDEYDQFAQSYISDTTVIDNVKLEKEAFETLAAIAGNRELSSQERKNNGFDKIQEQCQDSLQTLLSQVVDSATELLRNAQFAAQMAVEARQIIQEANQEEEAVNARNEESRKQNQAFRDLIKQNLILQGNTNPTEEDIDQALLAMGITVNIEEFDRDAFIQNKVNDSAKAEWDASDLDTNPTDRFPNEESARALLSLMVRDLSTPE
ncbi:hypothetical protein [Okeania hirsuta]|uniref:Uncharacterized protein n=1 Tax=Okeania hirsuta TaxID=1458930 RepID=A0A3N6P4K0_9CYAN|nr:hypothetical protein [Okeania hirsuta]RQH17203.1 hypothetical protein D4Z78_18115 [Okeania hirsuta]RQH23314.1 hypothetical protein D5R40_30430 [Okeania hirsuta]